jgi:hypothetical protein
MTHIAGRLGGVYTGAAQLIEDCQDAWNEFGYTGSTASAYADGKVGANCARATTDTVGATSILQSETLSNLDLSTYSAACWWARTSLTTAAGDLALLLSESAKVATPAETLLMPILSANAWHHCFGVFSGTAASRNLLISVGLYQVVDLANGTFDIDDVEALKEITGMKSWTLDYTVGVVDTTDFASAGVRDLLPAVSQWSGSFEGYKDGVPLSIGTEYYLTLGESNTDYQGWLGKAVITGAHPNVAFDGSVTYSYDFEGTAALEVPSA